MNTHGTNAQFARAAASYDSRSPDEMSDEDEALYAQAEEEADALFAEIPESISLELSAGFPDWFTKTFDRWVETRFAALLREPRDEP
jgi:hypothetical protein